VVIADKDGVDAAKMAAEASKLGAAAPALEVNVADRSAVERMTREARDWFGKIDILVNNAAFSRLGPLLS
jgi:NAD(P)-dependent dehydrogenase (short-subunit alcohol dehydrogenase family)